jgi:glycine cleavage system H protein
MPMSGEIVAVNEALEDTPELVNDDPYGDGWFIKIAPSDPGQWDDLLTPDAYEASAEA